MIIQSVTTTKNVQNKKTISPKKTNFGATTRDILYAATSGKITKENLAQRRFVGQFGLFFFGLKAKLQEIKDAPNVFRYNLKGKNTLPDSLKDIKVIDGKSNLKEVDEILQLPSKQDPNKTKGEILSEHLQEMGVENPEFIEITKTDAPSLKKVEAEAYNDFVKMRQNPLPIYVHNHDKK